MRNDDGFNVGDPPRGTRGQRGALASANNLTIVEGVNEGAAFFNAAAKGFLAGFVVARAMENDFGTVSAGCCDLDLRGGSVKDDLGANALLRGVKGDTLGVIAGAGGDDSTLALGFAERGVEGANAL